MTPLIIVSAVVGLVIGSFLNVVIHRVPAAQSLSRPGSRCPSCDHPIRARHNVPVLGWLVLRGRCADCRTPISVRYPLVELTTAALFAAVAWRLAAVGLVAALPALLYFTAIGICLTMIDIDVRRLPDAIVLPSYAVVAALLVAAAWLGDDPAALLRAAVGAAGLFAFYFVAAFAMMPVYDIIALLAARARAGRPTPRAVAFGPFMVAGALLAVFVGPTLADLYARVAWGG